MRKLIGLMIALFAVGTMNAQCPDLFFSEMIEGSSSNKALEIVNPTGDTIDLTDYVVYRNNNGSLSPSDSLFPQGMLAPGDVFVITNSGASLSGITTNSDTTSSMTFYNGDDAIWIKKISTNDTLDIIGEIGVDPGSGWPVGTGATNNNTLVRMPSIRSGQTDWAIGATEWIVLPIDEDDSLGFHTLDPVTYTGPCSGIFISEYVEGSSSNKAFELYNATDCSIDLTEFVVYRYNNGSLTATDSLFPQGILAGGDVFQVTNPSASLPGITGNSDTTHTLTFYNGDDAISVIHIPTGDTMDIIGEIGVDPGSGWPVGSGATNNFTLVRDPSVNEGTTNWTLGATQWLVFPIDMDDSLGAHTMTPCGAGAGPSVGFVGSSANVNEGAGTATIDVMITNPDMGNATSVDVVVNTGASTATGGGTDYTYTTTTVTFPAGSSANQSVTVTITDDMLAEGNETVVLELQNPTNNAMITVGTYTLTIEDNDFPTYPIAQVTGLDANGNGDSVGVKCWLHGVVYGVNLRPSGLQFTFIDQTDGISLFDFNQVSGYSVNETDSIAVLGTIGQFNGLLQVDPDSIILFSTGNTLKNATVTTVLDEATESDLVRFDNATLVNPAQWTGSGSGFNVDVTNGVDTIQVRIDADVDLYNQPAPTGTFNVCGLGGQFDSSSPYDEGYQLLPRYMADIKPLLSVNLGADTTFCEPGSLTLDAGTSGSNYLWSTGAMTQTITVTSSGTYWVEVSDSAMTLTASDTIDVTVEPLPVAAFGCTQLAQLAYNFTDSSQNAQNLMWDFGDGSTSSMTNPSHTYAMQGIYTVTLVAQNPCGNDTTTKQLDLTIGIDDLLTAGIRIVPNPNAGAFALEIDQLPAGAAQIFVTDLTGKLVARTNVDSNGGEFRQDMQLDVDAGVYFVRVLAGEKALMKRVVVE